VGRGNLNSSVAETLALNGNGTYSYIDSVKEARRALVESLGASLVTVAKDVKAAISFNPEYVESYRLIGYENKLLTEDEFYDEKTDAGEVGAGHTVTVAYEIVMKDGVTDESNIAELKLRYKSPNGDNAQDMELRASVTGKDITDGDETSAFVSAVIEFGLILRNSEYKADADLDTLINRLSGIELTDEYMIEFRELVSTYKRNLDE
jgi:Ca-activated chloride channel family protein